MRIQKYLAVALFALTSVSVPATAAIINQVDFPEAFTANDKAVVTEQESMTAADTQK
ncbi:hypothetical protein [Acinetobacter sp. TGL-Y2]|uniref:hypothetical protein n=1 Tax=Acinetobacter sp. TGL-Y2 TaxID=1407071 RepID=UPI000A926460|nr:hypothetical protein [Acinetobacter sp. TGL-Y2]